MQDAIGKATGAGDGVSETAWELRFAFYFWTTGNDCRFWSQLLSQTVQEIDVGKRNLFRFEGQCGAGHKVEAGRPGS